MNRPLVRTVNPSDVNAHVQVMQARLRLRVAGLLFAVIAILAILGFFSAGVSRVRDLGLAFAGGIALMVQYGRERALIRNRLAAVGNVMEYSVPLGKAPRAVRFLLSHVAPPVPRIKYSFTAFDQKTYTGEAGWNAAGLRVGLRIVVVYNPQNPARNYPLRSFVFHSFR